MTLLHYMTVSPKARRIVIDVFRKLPPDVFGLSTKQIYEKAVKGYNDKTDLRPVPFPPLGKEWRSIKGKHIVAPLPPNPEHPIRSMRYLKKIILDSLEEEGILVKKSRKHVLEDPKALEKWNQKRARLERRNALRMVNGEMPKPLPKIEATEWYWKVRTGDAWEKAKKALEEEEGEGKEKENLEEDLPAAAS